MNLKRFVTHLSLAAKQVDQRQKAKNLVQQHVQELKTVTRSSAGTVPQAVRNLERSVNSILQDEKALRATQREESKAIEQLHKQVHELRNRLYAKKSKKEVLKETKNQLTALEKKHKTLVKSGKHSKKDLDRLKHIISEHKTKIEKIK